VSSVSRSVFHPITITLCFTDKQAGSQVQFQVAEASNAQTIASIAIAAMVTGAVAIVAVDYVAIKASVMLLSKNLRLILNEK